MLSHSQPCILISPKNIFTDLERKRLDFSCLISLWTRWRHILTYLDCLVLYQFVMCSGADTEHIYYIRLSGDLCHSTWKTAPYTRCIVTNILIICMALIESYLTADIAYIPYYQMTRDNSLILEMNRNESRFYSDTFKFNLWYYDSTIYDTMIVQMVTCITYRVSDAPNHGNAFEDNIKKYELTAISLHILLLDSNVKWPESRFCLGI